jgi:hypothetical protein
MKFKKTILAIGVISLLVLLSFGSVTAHNNSVKCDLCNKESNAINMLFDEIELAAGTAHNYGEFLNLLRNILKNKGLESFPILKYIINKISSWVASQKNLPQRNNIIDTLFSKIDVIIPKESSKKYFVFSCGSYNRWNPRKDNEISLLKPGFEFWRYSGKSKLFKGRTIIVEKHPFGIKQRVMGSQIGLMMGFKGVYLDWESKLTGNAYTLFIGRSNRIRAFDTTPFSD